MTSATASLINEPPLLVLPTLAAEIGLNEAIFLQQVHYWVIRSNNIVNERKWVYNSTDEWQKQFPFWSERTILRIISNLCKKGILITGVFNRKSFDRTKWYTIDYDCLEGIEKDYLAQQEMGSESNMPDCQNASAKSGSSNMPGCHNGGESPESCIMPDCHDAFAKNGFSNMPDCHDDDAKLAPSILPMCHDDDANLSGPIPENNNKRITQRTTTTFRLSQLPMEKVPPDFTMDWLLSCARMYGISETTMRKYVRIYGESLLKKECALLKKGMEQKKIQNPAGWLCSALENRYEDTAEAYKQEKQARKAVADAKADAMGELYAQQTAEQVAVDPSSPFYGYMRHAAGKGGEHV